MIISGIPYYLSLLSNKLSYNQNIDKLFFKEDGELFDEFDHLYKTLFTSSKNYIKVVEALTNKRSGLTRKEISDKTNLPSNGILSKILYNLELSDYYTAFYFKYIKDNYGKDENYWSNSIDNPSRKSWLGLTFESLCKGHIPQIKNKLGISGVLTKEYVWNNKEAQIDLLIHGYQFM